jgi:hypothetical protein
MYGGVEVYLHTLTPKLDGGEWSVPTTLEAGWAQKTAWIREILGAFAKMLNPAHSPRNDCPSDRSKQPGNRHVVSFLFCNEPTPKLSNAVLQFNVHHRVQNRPPLVPILSHTILVHGLTYHSFNPSRPSGYHMYHLL